MGFTVSVTDNDGSACSATTFNLASTVPAGWTGSWSNSSLTLSPGGSGSATLQVTSPVGTADGFYNFSASATNASSPTYTGSASATYVISTPPAVSISVGANPSSASGGQTVTVNVTVDSGNSPDPGASVTVTVTPPGGSKGGKGGMSGTTGSNGVASFSYNVNKRATKGTYQVQSSTTANGQTVTASTTFQVQ